MTGIMKKMIRSDLSKSLTFLIISTLPLLADKAGDSASGKGPIYVTINGLRDEAAAHSCLAALNRYRQKRMLAIPQHGEGEFQIVVEKKRPGYQVRVEKMGTALKTARTLFDYEVCIAAAAITREAIADE